MASMDYWSCDACSAKTFYDARLSYNLEGQARHDGKLLPDGAGDMQCICVECAKTHRVVVVRIPADVGPGTGVYDDL